MSAMIDAAGAADWARVLELLKDSPDGAKEKDGDGKTPLDWAVEGKAPEAVLEALRAAAAKQRETTSSASSQAA